MTCDGSGRVGAQIGTTRLVAPATAFCPVERWTHVKIVHSGTEGRLYLNGVEVDVKQGRVEWKTDSTARLVLGDRKDGFVGILDSVRLSLVIPQDALLR